MTCQSAYRPQSRLNVAAIPTRFSGHVLLGDHRPGRESARCLRRGRASSGVVPTSREPVVQVAKDLGISESCLRLWTDRDDVDVASRESLASAEHNEQVERRRRNRVQGMEIEILKRAACSVRERVLRKWTRRLVRELAVRSPSR